MTIRQLPAIKAFERLSTLAFEPDEASLARWNADLRAANAEAGQENVISIYDVIGQDFWTGEGITSKRVAAALRAIGAKDVQVNINSPGGDFFEGVAIYNLLREHQGKVTVKVMGLAASAASVIAMAGDEIQISAIGFLMVHNAWVMAVGNRHDMLAAAETLAPFDDAMASLYATRAGADKAEAVAWMDKETWFNGQQAIDAGLADGLLPSNEVEEKASSETKSLAAVRRIDAALARQGVPRSERKNMISEIRRGTPGAAATSATPGAGDLELAAIQRAIATLRQ